MAPKDLKDPGGSTATAEPEQPKATEAAPPQTAEQTQATEQAMGLAPRQPAGQQAAVAAKVPVRLGMAPTNIEEGWRLAQIMAQSSLVPKGFQNKPGDVLVAIQMGVEIGFAPMQALQSIAVINGRPSVWGDGFLALIMSSPLYVDHDEYYEVGGERKDGLTAEDLKKDATTAVCTFVRRGKNTPVTRRFSIAQAKTAGLTTKDGPWKTYLDRMLMMRARSWAGRDAYPDLLRGIRTAEEALDSPEPEYVVEVPREVKRLSETKPDGDAAAATSGPTPVNAKPAEPTNEVTLGPVGVKEVEQFMGGFTVTFSDGQKVDMIDAADAMDLEKVKGTKHRVTVVAIKQEGCPLLLKSFSSAD